VVITTGLGFSLQLVTVRYLGRFLEDPLDVPTVVIDYVASQVGAADPSRVKAYLERKQTRYDHQDEICEVFGYSSYAAAKDRLLAWVGDQGWATGDGLRRCSTRRWRGCGRSGCCCRV
jgi:TnpA family transposase